MNRAPALLASMPLMPEWYFLVAVLAVLAVLSLAWSPLLVTIPVFMLAVAATLIQVGIAAAKQPLTGPPQQRLGLRMLIAWLHLIQPLARLLGRVRYGVAPWRWSGLLSRPVPLRCKRAIWSEEWQPIEKRLAEIERLLFSSAQP